MSVPNPTPDNFEYALEMTRVLREPDRRIDTFGDTRFHFLLLTEPMDRVNLTRIRRGEVEAEKPLLIRPDHLLEQIELDGFGDQARAYFDKLKAKGHQLALLKYGFKFKRSEITEELIHEPLEQVSARVLEQARREGDPLLAIISGVDDVWEACLLRFTLELMQQSQSTNAFDFKRKGLL